MRIGIIGGGIAGLATAWLLEGHHEVVLFEKENRLGGHADTIEVLQDGELVHIDAGFEFFSGQMFPRFNRLLTLIGAATHKYRATATLYRTNQPKTNLLPPYGRERMTWSAYSPSNLVTLVRLQNVIARSMPLIENADPFITLEQHLDRLKLPARFLNDFLYPFLLAEWCVEPEEFRTFSAYNALSYVVKMHPSGFPPTIWVNEVVGGMQAYVEALVGSLSRMTIKRNANITSISRNEIDYTLQDADGHSYQFDHLIIATNPRIASALLQSLSWADKLRAELDRFDLFRTVIAVHGDRRLMPANPAHWSVVNTRYDGRHSANTIWKSWKSKQPIFRSWVTFDAEMPASLYEVRTYDHLKINLNYYAAQRNLIALQGTNNLWLAGLYMHDIDCHESALMSAVNIARRVDPTSANLGSLMA